MNEKNADCQFLSVKEAARSIGMSYMFLIQRIWEGRGPPARKIGNRWKLPKDEFIEWTKKAN